MRTCNKCKCTQIKTRKNYSHGKKSKHTLFLMCKKCGSTDVEEAQTRYGRKKR